MSLASILALALAAGLSIPAGAILASSTRLRSICLRNEIDSFVSYFGGGALIAAISLVLVPRGLENLSILAAAAAFLVGGLLFWQLDAWVKRSGTSASQFAGMMLDFIPEAVILGASAATRPEVAYLLAGLIALQNMPEGFASFTEMRRGGMGVGGVWSTLLLAPLAGPLAAWLGSTRLSDSPATLGLVMLFCSGGILFLLFDDIAPEAHLERRDFPALGAVLGFLIGMVGTALVH